MCIQFFRVLVDHADATLGTTSSPFSCRGVRDKRRACPKTFVALYLTFLILISCTWPRYSSLRGHRPVGAIPGRKASIINTSRNRRGQPMQAAFQCNARNPVSKCVGWCFRSAPKLWNALKTRQFKTKQRWIQTIRAGDMAPLKAA